MPRFANQRQTVNVEWLKLPPLQPGEFEFSSSIIYQPAALALEEYGRRFVATADDVERIAEAPQVVLEFDEAAGVWRFLWRPHTAPNDCRDSGVC